MTSIDSQRFRRALLDERERVAAALGYIHEENPGSLEDETGEESVFDNHLGDTATATFDRELGYTLEENEEHLLAEIDAALRRIDDGTYGTCRVCGRPIGEERLEAVPWTTLCIDDARKQERG
jgi:RNA polymerase-binding protein DksA